MPLHTITVTLQSSRVIVDPNPLVADHNDQVTWSFPASPPMRVEFIAFMRRDTDPPDTGAGRNPFNPPFPGTGPTVGTGTIRPDARAGVYFYNVVDVNTGQAIKWQTHLLQALDNKLQPAPFQAFFGGIIIRDPPGQPAPSSDA